MTKIAAHFDGERMVLDEPVTLAAGTALEITILEDENARKARVKSALREMGRHGREHGISFEGIDLEDQDTYYDDLYRAGLDRDRQATS